MKTAATTTLVLVLLGAAVGAGNAQAQQKNQSSKPKQATEKSSSNYDNLPEPDIKTTGKRAKILLEQIDVVGRLSKPQAVFILPGSDPKVDGLKIDRSFLDDIFRPVEKDFFPQKGKRKFRGTIPW
ncbi:MAG: hypothetical protein H6696_18805 [Deferribacteres bacterium]|nr:hypothetical protein [candidate division KSB1 bacterium]MCB9503979.1 hypothetical protein [Deferribacteres bacterium]